jgi:plasmid stability protein
MASLIVRQLDDELVQRLKDQASRHGRSAEAEHRAILESALRAPKTGDALWTRLSRGVRMKIDLDRSGADQRPRPAEFE